MNSMRAEEINNRHRRDRLHMLPLPDASATTAEQQLEDAQRLLSEARRLLSEARREYAALLALVQEHAPHLLGDDAA